MLKPVNRLPGQIRGIHVYMKYYPMTHLAHPLYGMFVLILPKHKFLYKENNSPNNNKSSPIIRWGT